MSLEELVKAEKNPGLVVISELESTRDNIEDYIKVYFQIFFVIDGDVTNQATEVTLTAQSRREIYEMLSNFKAEIKGGNVYTDRWPALQEELKLKGVSQEKSQIIQKLFISNEDDPLANEVVRKGFNHISNALKILKKVQNDFSLTNQEIIEHFHQMSSLRGLKLKYDHIENLKRISCIHRGPDIKTTICSEEMEMCSDEIVKIILATFNDGFITYKLDFSDINAIFNDEVILSFLVAEELDFRDIFNAKLLDEPLMTPLLSKLVYARKFIPNKAELLSIIKNLLADANSMKYISTLLKTDDDHLAKTINMKDAKKYLLNEISSTIISIKKYPTSMEILVREYPKEILNYFLQIYPADHQQLQLLRTINMVSFDWYKEKAYKGQRHNQMLMNQFMVQSNRL